MISSGSHFFDFVEKDLDKIYMVSWAAHIIFSINYVTTLCPAQGLVDGIIIKMKNHARPLQFEMFWNNRKFDQEFSQTTKGSSHLLLQL